MFRPDQVRSGQRSIVRETVVREVSRKAGETFTQRIEGRILPADLVHQCERIIGLTSVQSCGKAEVVKYPASGGGMLVGKKGVILFEVSGWSDAQGHATLFNGQSCYDHCYFNEPEAKYRTDRANFWGLR